MSQRLYVFFLVALPFLILSGKPQGEDCRATLNAGAEAHKFYLSNTEIDYAANQHSLQIISRVFTDDFEELLQKRYDEDIEFTKNSSSENINGYIKRYFKEKFRVSIEDKHLTQEFIGREFNDNRTAFYFEIKNVDDFDRVKVKNTVLMDVFDAQKNMVHVSQNGATKTLVLTKDKSTGIFKFDN